MCGRYTLHTDLERLIEQFELFRAAEIKPRYNISPSQMVPVIRPTDQGRELALLRWGLVPHWAKEEKTGYSMINARAETVTEKPAFRSAFRRRRCLIPADGFYEWKKLERAKQPFHIRMRGGEPFAFAGLWEHWQGGEGKTIESCSIIVTTANDLMRPIHDRMPAILDRENYGTWLDPDFTDAERLKALLAPYPSERMESYPVSAAVNSPKNEVAGCVEQVSG
jgi:putative SOS response-associated peptidase YedK